jgi:hypothetical protein
MWVRDWQTRSGFSSGLDSFLMVILLMLPVAAHGEWEIHTSASTFLGGLDLIISGGEVGQVESDYNQGFGFGMAYWFAKAPVLGVGLDFQGGFGHAGFHAFGPCVLMRIPFGQNSAFPHGKIVPYVGAGPVIEDMGEEDFELYAEGLLFKAGLEWMILSWAGISIEGRYLTGDLEGSKKNYRTVDYPSGGGPWPWRDPYSQTYEITSNGVAHLSNLQLAIGIALHF